VRSADDGRVKSVAALLVLVMSGVIAAPITCAGWEMSPSDRRECCLRAHHQHCQDQASADDCCAGHEQDRQALTVQAPHGITTADLLPASAVPSFAASALYQTAVAHYTTVFARRLHGPPVLLAPPLRI
jgi:hypothetical protein